MDGTYPLHGGLDIKTGRGGSAVYAPLAEGYISRLKRSSFGGYGNVLCHALTA
jgi:murein DD-endopeptidase MepM/ murein hydrolase activator NlpD